MNVFGQANFKSWNDALKEKDYEKVASLYSKTDLSFLPTVSPKFIQDGQSTKEYFMEFLKKLPDGTITADDVQSYGTDSYLHTGLYTFMTGPDDNRQPVEARFSYMWRKEDGAWKIVHHHSSAVPNAPGSEAPPAGQEAKSDETFRVALVQEKARTESKSEDTYRTDLVREAKTEVKAVAKSQAKSVDMYRTPELIRESIAVDSLPLPLPFHPPLALPLPLHPF